MGWREIEKKKKRRVEEIAKYHQRPGTRQQPDQQELELVNRRIFESRRSTAKDVCKLFTTVSLWWESGRIRRDRGRGRRGRYPT